MPLVCYLLAFVSKNTFTSAWCFGLGYFGAGISWVHVSIADFGGVPLAVSILLMLMLCGYLALYPAILFKVLDKFFKRQYWPLAIPFAWFVMEWLRARVMTGFPWLSIGYSQSNSILSAWLPLIGEIGLSVLIVVVSIALAVGCKQKKYIVGALPLLVLLTSAYGLSQVNWVTPNGETKKVALVQGNIPQSMRWDPEQDEITRQKYMGLTENLWQHDIIIWPEAAVPSTERLNRGFIAIIDEQATRTQTGLITGVVSYNHETGVAFNSLLALGIDEEINSEPYKVNHAKRFSKHHLLPIGEFVPFESVLRKLAPIFDLPMSSFSRGDYVQKNLIVNSTHLVPAICFEIAFPRQISANILPKSNAIITVSNDAWFGNSHGPHQHLQIAQVRAKEFGLPVLRATNNGVTAVVDHNGIIQAQLPQFTAAHLSETIHFVDGTTPYTIFGDWPILCLSVVALILVFWMMRQK